MPRLVTMFVKEVSVPQWELCNGQESNTQRRDDFCDFLKGDRNERYCILFKKSLFSCYEWTKKCDECLKLCNLEEKKKEEAD